MTEGRLCDPCSRIDFDQIANIKMKDLQSRRGRKEGVPIASLMTRSHQIPADDCPLCHLFYAYIDRSGHQHETYQLRAFSYIHASKTIDYLACGKKIRRRDILCLAMPHTNRQDYIFCLRKTGRKFSVVTPQKLEPKFEMAICKEWLGYCQENHKLCRRIGTLPSRLRVIDCQSLEIIAAPPQALYVALSYVWGSGHHTHENGFSRTIRDTIAVTKALGYEYLWVDKYCIEQESDDDKHHQISQMDLVYQAADLTIIAAAGKDADAGLPGVLDTPRNQQPVVEIGDFVIINSMPHPHDTIAKSKWSTRAWTLQEAVLSRRRLAFTPDQTYFECDAMNCCESLLEDRLLLHSKFKDRAKWYCHSGIFSRRSESPFRSLRTSDSYSNPSLLITLIEQYTARDLSYDQDSLNAFTGILKRFCKASPTKTYVEEIVHHIWGLPFRCIRTPGSLVGTQINVFWRHKVDGHSAPTLRKAFPSWSWAGWSGAIVFTGANLSGLEKKIWLELVDGSRHLFEHVLRTAYPSRWTQLSQPHALHFRARFADMTQLFIDSSTQCRSFDLGLLHGTFFWSVPQNNTTDLVARFENREYELMAVESPSNNLNVVDLHYLVVERHPGFYSRVGEAEISGPPTLRKRRFVRLR